MESLFIFQASPLAQGGRKGKVKFVIEGFNTLKQ